MSSHANHGAQRAGRMAAGAGIGSRLLHTAAKHPFLLFGIGIVAGVYLYKYSQTNAEGSACCEKE